MCLEGEMCCSHMLHFSLHLSQEQALVSDEDTIVPLSV